ncbi:Splicing factor 3B subunit 1 [Perkinsus olseni]|uniref:Splicing factor 3B subunit 1 n=1 Tax=Perkinsus olseni TaxID=32597 RepID=A0A7J6TI71_PEROL|nr:Splicing factor 3B subunit 1 [Perkinsus olseni]
MASSSSWTEVNLSKWATNHLSDSCNWECLEYPQRVGESTPTLKVLKVHVRGCDATATMSKKGITAIYEIRMTADVKVTLPIDKGKSLCEAKGEISVPCIDSVDAEDGFRDTKVNFIPSMNYQPGADENLRALMCSLLERCKQDLPLVVRRALVQFDRRIKEEASNVLVPSA